MSMTSTREVELFLRRYSIGLLSYDDFKHKLILLLGHGRISQQDMFDALLAARRDPALPKPTHPTPKPKLTKKPRIEPIPLP